MPAKKRPADAPDRDWTLAAWEWAGELSAGCGLGVRVSMVPTRRLGVWSITWAAVHVVDGRVAGVVAKYAAEWPTSEHVSLPAFLFNGMGKLDAIVAQDFMGAAVDVDAPVGAP